MTNDPERQNQRAYIAAQSVATGLLVIMLGVYAAAEFLAHQNPTWRYVRAFAEAALVGGLADWFAVTALFRRPLGLPIPHTGVIPNNKARIADSLGQFIVTNFLAPDLVRERLAHVDIAQALAKTLADPGPAARIADGVAAVIPALLDTFDDDRVAPIIRKAVEAQAADMRVAPLLGEALDVLTQQGRHQPLVDAAIDEGWRTLEENEEDLRARVRERTSWLWRIAGVDANASDALIGAVRATLAEIAAKPDHPTRARVTAWLAQFAQDLKTSPELAARVDAIKKDLLAHPAVGSYFDDLWGQLKAGLRRSAGAEHGGLREPLARALQEIGAALLADDAARAALNDRLRGLLTAIAARHGADVAKLVSDTIRGWDTATITGKLEQSVGRDLQYIRINGTLVGGLVGLSIYSLTTLLKGSGL